MTPAPQPPELTGVTKGWVANTWDGSPGGVTNSSQWVPIAMDGFFVKENDGSLYGATMWDEGGHESSTWSADGDMLGALVDTHGWARGGGQDIAADDNFVYSSQRQAPCGDGVSQSLEVAAPPGPCTWPGGPSRYPNNETWYTIRRYKNQPGYPADNVSESGGVGMGYDWSMTVIATTLWSTTHKASDTSILTGLAVGGGIVAVSLSLSLSLSLSRARARALSRSLALSLSRSLALSLSRSLARSLALSLALSLSRSLEGLRRSLAPSLRRSLALSRALSRCLTHTVSCTL